MIENARAKGASDAVILQKQQEMENFKEMYANPIYNPVGLLITSISAAIVKKKPALHPAQSAAPPPERREIAARRLA